MAEIAVSLQDGEIKTFPQGTVVADALKCRCGSCFHVVWNQEREKAGLDQDMSEDTTSAVQVGVEALKRLIQADHAAQ